MTNGMIAGTLAVFVPHAVYINTMARVAFSEFGKLSENSAVKPYCTNNALQSTLSELVAYTVVLKRKCDIRVKMAQSNQALTC